MTQQTRNLSDTERAVSALIGLSLSVLSLRRGSLGLRALTGVSAAGLLARAFAGHCAVKAALAGHSSLREGIVDQWHGMAGPGRPAGNGMPGSPAHAATSDAVDESIDESFPASDPPASRLPDVPPANAEAKWEAVRAAQQEGTTAPPGNKDRSGS
jgi:hypothetical protein